MSSKWKSFFSKLADLIVEWLKLKPKPQPPPVPPPDDNDLFVVEPGKYVFRKAEINKGGSIEFDVWIPEAGRGTDWNKAAVLEIFEKPNLKDGEYGEIMPYKIKTCVDATCKEPRYNLVWDTFRHMKISWDMNALTFECDGTRLSSAWQRGWVNDTLATICYGDRPGGLPPLTGAKYKNIKWNINS